MLLSWGVIAAAVVVAVVVVAVVVVAVIVVARAMGMGMGDGGCVARGPNTPQACDEPPSAPQRMAAHALLAISKLN